jgi:hypothetical protein
MYILDIPCTDGGYFTGPESFYETPDTSRTLIEENTGRKKSLKGKDQERKF